MGRDIVLDVLGTVLSSLSCIFLLFAICILQFCKGVQSSPRISITKQLCVSLFLSHLFLILFLDRDMLKLSNVGCEAMAGVLHYLLTASICWMLVEGLQLFHTVHFTLDPTSFMVVYWVIGYGVPAVVVLVTLLVAFGSCQWNTQDAYGDSEYCWLTAEEGYIWAFTGPLVVVIVANAIFMVCALRSAAILTANKRKSLHHRIMLYIKGSFSLNCVLGVTWVFGLLYINSNHFFAYVFTILNASQGVMIFVFNCVLNENVWTAFVSSLPATFRQRLMKRALQLQLNNAHLTPLDGHHHNPVSRRRSQRDMTELDRGYDRSQREEKWRYPPLTADVLCQAFTIVATSPCQLPRHSGHLPQKAIRRVSVPARVSPPDHRVSRRKESQWSAETQISFISASYSSNLLSRLEHSLRIYPSHKETGNPHLAPDDDMQRCIHTIPECEERSSSEKNIHFF
ncbi:Adhesion G protein-coupled receptor L3 [Portunus trituberculatus]|uniref:Adhesion G protein-coupled receptor L3 n=1 Tax=Portunus trituberculatus TaxID=210409 RepID=A0A5B7FNN4_PORTR|nr:Adhesion G protein-coupled receptor L3 [Portunus trituberculatus]